MNEQPQTQSQELPFHVPLTMDEVNLVLAHLDQGVHARVRQVIDKIINFVNNTRAERDKIMAEVRERMANEAAQQATPPTQQ